MKWIPVTSGYFLSEGVYRANIGRTWGVTFKPGKEFANVTKQPDGWIWRVNKGGKIWKKGIARLLKDCKQAAEDAITADILEVKP